LDANGSLIAELERAIQSGSKDRRVDALRRITDLFVADADRLSDQQIDVFDDVLGHLIKRIEGRALAELSQRLGHINNAPVEVVRRLARDDDVAIAAPVLTQSKRLSEDDLIEVAKSKPHGHLVAIASRSQITPSVTDVLLDRGDRYVFHRLAENSGASFSENGYATLVRHSERDDWLAEKIGIRLDIPIKLFRELLLRATEAVRSRLLAMAGPDTRHEIQSVLAAISDDAQHEAGIQNQRDHAAAYARVLDLKNNNQLNEAVFFEFAKGHRSAEIVAALALLCGVPMLFMDALMQGEHREAWLIPCKVARLDWSTVRVILSSSCFGRVLSSQALDAARADYLELSQTSAGRVLRFWQVRQATIKDVGGGLPSSGGKIAGALAH